MLLNSRQAFTLKAFIMLGTSRGRASRRKEALTQRSDKKEKTRGDKRRESSNSMTSYLAGASPTFTTRLRWASARVGCSLTSIQEADTGANSDITI
jgi:hypothetical protein